MNKGFSIIEIILAAGVFVIFATGITAVVVSSFTGSRQGEEQTKATQFASEGLEAVRSIKNQAFSNLVATTSSGVTRFSGVWSLFNTNNVFEKFTRTVAIASVQRDGLGNIVASGGTLDPLTKKVTSTVSWVASPGRADSVILSSYLCDWRRSFVGNWTTPSQQATLNLGGNQNGNKVAWQGNYAYIVRQGGTPNFAIIDVSNPAAPSLTGSLVLTGDPLNIFVSGNFAYIASNANASELQIVNVSLPAAPSLIGTFDATGNADANGIYVSGTNVFLTRAGNSSNYLIINLTTPSSPTLTASMSLAGPLYESITMGNYSFVASGDNASELQVINVSSLSSPSLAGSLNLTGNADAVTITGYQSPDTIFLGQNDGIVSIVNVGSPLIPAFAASYAGGTSINDISLGVSNSDLFMATANGAAEFQVLNVSNPTSPSLLGLVNLTSPLNGVIYDSDLDRAYVVGNDNAAEFIVMQPGP